VGLLDILNYDLQNMMNDLPIAVTFQGHTFTANRSTYRRDNSLRDGGFLDGLAMTITAAYNSITQSISLGDILVIGARKFRVTSAELSQDAISVDFNLEDINK
jgi:hypothetical protein